MTGSLEREQEHPEHRAVQVLQHIDPSVVAALQQLCAAYWYCADETSDGVGELFCEDGVLTLGSLVLTGRAAIEEFFREREASMRATGRTTRHLGCNFQAIAVRNRCATLRSVAIVHSGTGELPLPAAAPAGIVDFSDECVQDASGRWRFANRFARTVFTGAGAPSFAS